MSDMADSSTGSRLFVRQSSGLVRDVSVTNALLEVVDELVELEDDEPELVGPPPIH